MAFTSAALTLITESK